MRERLTKYLLVALLIALVPTGYRAYVSYRRSEETRLALETIGEHACCDSPDKLISKLRRVLSKAPDSLEARLMLAEAYDSKCDYPEEEHQYTLAIQSAPNSSECYYRLGEFHLMRTRRYAQAVAAFQKCLAIDRGYRSANQMLARSYEKMGNRTAALRCWRAALRRKPDDEIAQLAVARLTQVMKGRTKRE